MAPVKERLHSVEKVGIARGQYGDVNCRTCNYKVVGSNPTKLTADFTMSIFIQLLNHKFLICAVPNPNVCMREIGCCQLGVYIPLWEFAEFP